MKIEDAIKKLLDQPHPKFVNRKMTKFYIAKIIDVQPAMIDRWAASDYIGISDRVVTAFKENFNFDLKGHQSILFIDNGVLKASVL